MANDSFNLFVSSFVSFSINGLKENAENLNFYAILRRKVEQMLSTAATMATITVKTCREIGRSFKESLLEGKLLYNKV